MKRKALFLSCFLLVFSLAKLWAGGAYVLSVSGEAQRAAAGTEKFAVLSAETILSQGDVVRTGSSGRIVLQTEQGHKIQVEPNTKAQLYSLTKEETQTHVSQGAVQSWVKKLKKQEKFSIKTPTATCAVRGTHFAVMVGELTRVEVYEGVVAAREELTGSEVMVKPGEFTEVRPSEPPKPPEPLPEKEGQAPPLDQNREQLAKAYQEIYHELSREAVMERAAEEIKLAELQNGKALIDAFGQRVRLEEYILREASNQFKYVVLNTRGDRFDFGKITFTFNKDLPDDLRLATKEMTGRVGSTASEWYPTDVLSIMSNTVDQVNETASGGTMVPDDAQDPGSWKLFFDQYVFSVNGTTKWAFDDDGDGVAQAREYTFLPGTAFASSTPPTETVSQPGGAGVFHFKERNDYADGTFVQVEDFVMNDDGVVFDAANPTGFTKGDIKDTILGLNFERVYTATEMGSRKIDLVFSAKLLADAGILSLPSNLSASGTSSLASLRSRRE